MDIIEATDDDLRTIIFDYPRVIVMFISEDCPICKELKPYYQDCAGNPKYQHVAFVRMDAHANPVSSREVALSGTPFFAAYRGGILVYCSLISTEEGMESVLKSYCN